MFRIKIPSTRSFLIFLLFFASNNLYGQTVHIKDKLGIDSVCNKFLQTFIEKKYTLAINMLKKYSVMEAEQIDLLATTVESQLASFTSLSGNVLSYEFIKETSVKDFLIKRIYLLKFEKAYLRLNFTFYLNDKGWVITFFDYSENIDDLF